MVRAGVKNAELAKRLNGNGIAGNRGVCSGKDQPGGVSSMVHVSRHARHWRTYVALGIAVAAAAVGFLLTPQEPRFFPNESRQAANRSYYPGGVDCKPDKLARLLPSSQHTKKADKCAQEAETHNAERQSVVQATRSAQATEQTAILAYHQAVVGAVTVTFLILAFAASVWAAWAAARAAKAADRTLEHSQKSAERQSRPYVFMDVRDFNKAVSKSDAFVALQIRLTWKNMGLTPARNVSSRLTIGAFDYGTPEGIDFPDVADFTQSGSIGPGGTIVSWDEFPATKFVRENGTLRTVYYWAWVEYDGFEGVPRHRTEVCARIVIGGDLSTEKYSISDVFETAFNGADESCYKQPKPKP